jgi:peptide/nickel transport system substrate-binding protein
MRFTSVALALFLVACSEGVSNGPAPSGGTIVIATLDDPGTLFPPFVMTNSAKQISEQIYDYLADVGANLDTRDEKSYRAELADSWRWSADSLSLTFHLNPRARWHDGQPVTARDVRFTFDLNKNPAIASRYQSSLENIDSVTIADSSSAVFWFRERRPTQFLDAAAQLLILPAHQLEKLAQTRLRESLPPPIGSGRFRLRRWDKGVAVELVSDTTNYRGRARLDRAIWSVTRDFTAAVSRVARGDADLFDGLRPENASDIARGATARAVMLPGMDYAFLRFNLRDPANATKPHPLFGDRELRRAIAMSLDRNSLARSLFDTFASVPSGPTVRAYATTDTTLIQIPFDLARANRLLDSLGWMRAADGVRGRNGSKLTFSLLVPTTSLNRTKIAVLIQEQLRRVGIQVNTDRLDNAAMIAKEQKGDFDASLDAWTMSSSPDGIRDAWSSSGVGKNGVNYGGYTNPLFDTLLDSALRGAPGHARERFTAAYRVINEDAPAVWLYEARKIVGIHRRFTTGETRADSWWFSLADWSVDPTRRLLRDRIPPGR